MTELALCETCKVERVKGYRQRYCSIACVPLAVRQEAGRAGRKTGVYRRRAIAFRADIARLTDSGERVTREDLLDVLAIVYRRAYHAGFFAGRHGGSVETPA
jgi:hypothetical protein